MRRFLVALLGAAAAMAGPAGPAAAARSDDTQKPVLFVAGQENGTINCERLWGPLIGRLRAMRTSVPGEPNAAFVGEFVRLSPYASDEGCRTFGIGARTVGVAQAGRDLAKYIADRYGTRPVDIVAYGTGGVIVRQALGQAAAASAAGPLNVEDVVTIGTPHAGSPNVFGEACRHQICQQLDSDEELGRGVITRLTQPPFDHPVGSEGTDWSTIGSSGDATVSAESANGMPAAAHKTTYMDSGLGHAGLLTDASPTRDAKIEYSHGSGPTVRWNKAPHVADRVGLELIFGAGQTAGPQPGCTGYSGAGRGPRYVQSDGLVEWPGPANQTLGFIKVGLMEAYAACFKRLPDGRFESDGVVRMNGVDIHPDPGVRVTVDPERRLVSTGTGLGYLALPTRSYGGTSIRLSPRIPIHWGLPARQASGGTNEAEEDREAFQLGGDQTIGGLKLRGRASVKFGQGTTAIDVSLGLPAIFEGKEPAGLTGNECRNGRDDDGDGGIDYVAPVGVRDDPDCLGVMDPVEGDGSALTLSSTFKSDNEDGFRMDTISGELATDAKFGRFALSGGIKGTLSVNENAWSLDARILIPIPPRSPNVSGGVDVKQGAVTEVRFAARDLKVPIGTTPVLFQDVRITVRPDPWQLKLGVGLSVFPRAFPVGSGLVAPKEFDGDLTIDAKAMKLEGKVRLMGEEFATGSLEYTFAGSGVTFRATVGKDWEFRGRGPLRNYEFKTKVQGQVDAVIDQSGVDASLLGVVCLDGRKVKEPPDEFKPTCLGDAKQRLTVRSSRIAYSSCAGVDLLVWSGTIGFGVARSGATGEWDYRVVEGVCDFDEWHAAPAQKAGSAGGGHSVELAGTSEAEVFAIEGDSAPPGVVLVGPGGERHDANAAGASGERVVRGSHAVMRSDADNTTYVVVAKPARGAWRVEPQAGSAAVLAVRTASALPEPDVRARVVRRRGRYELRWSATPRAGQRITFEEKGTSVNSEIGVAPARARRGTIRFRPAFGPRGRRTIVARVEQDGFARAEPEVARYTAPAPRLAGRPRGVRVRRRGARLVVTWRRTPGAIGYRVTVSAPPGSEPAELALGSRARRATIAAQLAASRPRITVRAVRRDGTLGPAVARRAPATRR